MRKDVTLGFDEVAHASYIAYLQGSGEPWPAFADMRMLDPSSFRFTGEANYLNHPSPYYLLLARLGRTMLLVFLIAGPVVFGLLGAPLG